MPTQLHDISEAIGNLRADVRNLGQTLEGNSRRADEHRAAIHKRVDEVVQSLGHLSTKVEVIEDKLVSVESITIESKTVTDQVKMWEQRGMGALAVVGFAGTLFGGAVVSFVIYWWDAIMKVLRSV